MSGQPTRGRQGFASMDEVKQREIASKGGSSVPAGERSFSKDHGLAAEAGRKGGQSVAAEARSFSKDHQLASEAGRKGGEASRGGGSHGGAGSHGAGSHASESTQPGSGGSHSNFAEDRERASEAGRKGGQH